MDQKNVDPTVCYFCAFDNGNDPLPNTAGVPTCPDCYKQLINRPFPLWVKVFFLLLVVFVIMGMSINGRFFQLFLK